MSIQPETYMDAPTIATLNAGDNTFGAGANGISILEDVLTVPNGITLNSVGISYDSGTTITANTWDDITTRISYLSAIAPNGLNPTILAVNNTLFIENADTAPTRVINVMAGDTSLPSEHFGILWEGDTLPFVMETLDATPLEVKDTTFQLNDSITPLLTTMTASTLSSGASSASWATIIAGSATPNIQQVLSVGDNAGALNITNLNNVDLQSINNSAYPPATQPLGTVLANGNSADLYDINMNFNNILNCNNINTSLINNLSPTTIGLTWGDFTGSNAFANLPNQAYQVDSGGNNTSQYYDRFAVYNSATPCYTTINSAGMELLDVNSATTTYYGSNTISSNNATAFTITAGTSSSQPLNLNCSSLVINGTTYAIPRPIFYGSGSNGFSLSGGSFQNQGAIYTFQTGLTANTAYIMSVNFIVYTNVYQNDGAMYVDFNNSNGTYQPTTYSASRPVAQTGSGSTFNSGASGTSQFVFNDWVNFTTDSNSQLIMEFYLGSSSGWNGNYYWSMFANIISP